MATTLIILSTLAYSALSLPILKTWTLNEISTALELQTHPQLQTHLEHALNTIMFAMFTESEQDVLAVLLSPSGQREWTKEELFNAAHNSSTNPNYKPFIKNALQYLKHLEQDNKHEEMKEVTIPALDISVWTPQDVDEAKLDPNLPADVWKLLKKVDKEIKKALERGTSKDKVTATLVTPVGIVPTNGEYREIVSSTKDFSK